MRTLALLAAFALFGCQSGDNLHADAAPMSLDAASCGPSGSCASGLTCGTTCCGSGEQCVQGACMCGTQPSCNTAQTGNTCFPGGGVAPLVAPAFVACGVVCCGNATTPCPI